MRYLYTSQHSSQWASPGTPSFPTGPCSGGTTVLRRSTQPVSGALFQNHLHCSLTMFFQVSQALENTGVGAYLGAAPVIFSRQILGAAGSIALIEARHAGWLNSLVNVPITTNVFGQEQSFERALTISEVVHLASPFVASLNGGPPLTFSLTPSADNDIAILNFALALEYLEAEFYNLNVPKFFGPGPHH